MEEFILQTVDTIQKAGFVGLLIVLAVPKLRKAVFNMDSNSRGVSDLLKNHEQRLEIANREVGRVNDRLTALEAKIDIIGKHLKLWY
jgi:hypothetical protein